AKWIVIAAWVLVVAASGPLQGLLEERSTNASSGFLPITAESTKVGELLRDGDVFEGGEQVPAIVVFQHADGDDVTLDEDQEAAIRAWLEGVVEDAELPEVAE